MELSEVLSLRHAQRAYTGEKISRDQLEAILQAGELAPVALGKFENYHLTVIEDPEILNSIESATATLFHRHGGKMLYGRRSCWFPLKANKMLISPVRRSSRTTWL